ncbi:MAG TPA: hypothetical protein VF178_08375 [Gemmatimonadaceae bacterium]
MGLIRKTLAVGTAGTVHGSSKKQRVARAAQQAAERQAAEAQKQTKLLEQQAAMEFDYRYETDPEFRAYIDAKRAAEAAAVEASTLHVGDRVTVSSVGHKGESGVIDKFGFGTGCRVVLDSGKRITTDRSKCTRVVTEEDVDA